MQREEGVHGEGACGSGGGRREEAKHLDSWREKWGKEEGAAGAAFLHVCVTEEARAFERALVSGRPGTSISH